MTRILMMALIGSSVLTVGQTVRANGRDRPIITFVQLNDIYENYQKKIEVGNFYCDVNNHLEKGELKGAINSVKSQYKLHEKDSSDVTAHPKTFTSPHYNYSIEGKYLLKPIPVKIHCEKKK